MREVARLVNELMDTDNKLLSIVTSIYDAALDDSRWNEVLDRVVTFTGGRAGGLVSFRPTGEIEFAQGIGFAAPFVQSYIENYGSIDPARTVRYAEIGQVLTAEDWAPIDHFRSSRFYREWARPQGLEDGVNVLLTRSATSISHISVSKAGSLVDGAMRDAMSRLVPHLRRAIAINQKLRHEGAVAASSIQAIEALRTALFLLDPRGHILHANASGRDILDQKQRPALDAGAGCYRRSEGQSHVSTSAGCIGPWWQNDARREHRGRSSRCRRHALCRALPAPDGGPAHGDRQRVRGIGRAVCQPRLSRPDPWNRADPTDLQADADRAARPARHRRHRRRARCGQKPRRRRNDRPRRTSARSSPRPIPSANPIWCGSWPRSRRRSRPEIAGLPPAEHDPNR